MSQLPAASYVAFEGDRRVAAGRLTDVARAAKELLDRRMDASILVFDGASGAPIDIDFRGTIGDVLARLPGTAVAPAPAEDTAPSAPRGPGRPKLGVIAREVTLLPRHWEWLAQQPGGASVALRKLVEEASRDRQGRDKRRRAQEATYRFLSAMAGDRPHFEEATRALFAGDNRKFGELVATWPPDIADHARRLGQAAFEERS